MIIIFSKLVRWNNCPTFEINAYKMKLAFHYTTIYFVFTIILKQVNRYKIFTKKKKKKISFSSPSSQINNDKTA